MGQVRYIHTPETLNGSLTVSEWAVESEFWTCRFCNCALYLSCMYAYHAFNAGNVGQACHASHTGHVSHTGHAGHVGYEDHVCYACHESYACN